MGCIATRVARVGLQLLAGTEELTSQTQYNRSAIRMYLLRNLCKAWSSGNSCEKRKVGRWK